MPSLVLRLRPAVPACCVAALMACAAPHALAQAKTSTQMKAPAPSKPAAPPKAPAPAAASPIATTTYPASLDDQELRGWMKKETDIPPASVVAISPLSVIAIMQSQTTTSPQGYEVTVRAEILDPAFALQERLLSWHATIKLGCADRTVLVGAATGHTQRNLLGDGRAIEVSGQGGWKPVQEGTIQGQIWSARCDRSFVPPLADIAAESAGPISTAPRMAAERPPAPATLPPLQAAPPAPAPTTVRPPPAAAPAPGPTRSAPLPAPELRLTPQPAGDAPARPAPAPRPTASASVQVLASPIPAEAQHALAALRTRLPDGLAGLRTEVVAVETGSGINHRAIVSGFKAPGEATKFCQKLTAAGGKCFVRGDGGLAPGERSPAR